MEPKPMGNLRATMQRSTLTLHDLGQKLNFEATTRWMELWREVLLWILSGHGLRPNLPKIKLNISLQKLNTLKFSRRKGNAPTAYRPSDQRRSHVCDTDVLQKQITADTRLSPEAELVGEMQDDVRFFSSGVAVKAL